MDVLTGFLGGPRSGLGGQEEVLPVVREPRSDAQLGVAVARRGVDVVDAESQQHVQRPVGVVLARASQGGAAEQRRAAEVTGPSERSPRDHLPRDRRVLARQLRRRAFLLLLLAIQARLPAPGALEVVADVEAEPAQPFGLDLDPVAVLESAEAAMVRAGRDDVAGVERVDRRDPLDAARDLVS